MKSGQERIHKTAQGWYVKTEQGTEGPLASRQEASTYLALLSAAEAARQETVNRSE